MNPKHLVSAAALALFSAMPVAAQEAGTITFGLGVHNVDPKSDNGNLAGMKASVGSSTRPTITAEYFVYDNVGIELLAALPFKHDVKLDGNKVASVKQLPPVLSVQYHFVNNTKVTPFVGLGVNFTTFFSEDSDLGNLSLKNSWGLAAHLGADIALNEKAAIRIDARWIDIDSEVRLNGQNIGTANIDPLVYGMAYVWKF